MGKRGRDRTHQQTFHSKENPLKRSDLDDLVACYLGRDGSPQPSAGDSVNRPYLSRHERKEPERFKSFSYGDLIKRDKLNLDIFWLKDESLEDSALSLRGRPDIKACKVRVGRREDHHCVALGID